MNLFELAHTPVDQAELDALRSQLNVARAVLHYRLDCGLSQTELANLSRTTQARVSEIEAMKGDPKLSTLARLAHALGCVIDMVPIPTATATPTPPGFNPVGTTGLTTSASSTLPDRWRLATTLG